MLHGGLPLLLAGREQGVEGITEGGRISSLVSAGAALVRGRQGPQPQRHGPGLAGLQGVLEQWRRLGPFTAGVDGPLLTLDQEAVEAVFLEGRAIGLAVQTLSVGFVIGEQPLGRAIEQQLIGLQIGQAGGDQPVPCSRIGSRV